ncbi:MAG: hypothetical protein K6357_05860 [Elusimicrobiota bacterium]
MAVLMFSYTNAEETKMDFDGKVQRTESIIETIKANIDNANALNVSLPKPEPEVVNNTDKMEERNLDYSIKTAIEYCKKQNFSILENNFRNLLIHGTREEKYEFVYNAGKTYVFPLRIRRMSLFDNKSTQYNIQQLSKTRLYTCIASHIEEECINRPVCRIVCTAASTFAGSVAGGHTGAAVAIGVSGQICQELCELIPECSLITVCDK